MLHLLPDVTLLHNAQASLGGAGAEGFASGKSAAQQRAEFVRNYYSLQRGRLDAAFDADVREIPELSKD